VTTHIHSN